MTVNTQKSKFINSILSDMNIETARFMDAVIAQAYYETMLYRWMIKLYRNQKPLAEATAIIFKARRIYYFKRMKYGCD